MADTRPRPPAAPTPPASGPDGDGEALQTTEHGVKVHEVRDTTTEREFTVQRRSQTQMVIRRFMAHKLAVGSLVVFVLVVIISLVGGRFWKYGYADITDEFSSPPSLEHPMGTDDIGHDSLAQVLRGAQKSVQVALMVALLATTLGTVIGALAGYYRGWVDSALMRFTDLVLTIPSIAILAVLASTVASQAGNWFFIGLVLALLQWTYIARVVRGTFLSLREKEFVEAARALGASDSRIMFRHLLPNASGSIIVNATITVAIAILAVLASTVASQAGNWFFIGLILALLQWTYIARVVRGTFLSLREKEFVEAARALGASDTRIMFRHLLPNATGSIIVNATVTVAIAILLETALSFLGLGIKPPDTSLGLLVSTGQQAATTRPWLFYFPGLVIIVIALTINFVGDGLRDAFDPTQTRVRA
jgi:ABC-type dipeptide/oligopeptide/nickel transport system permease subunit